MNLFSGNVMAQLRRGVGVLALSAAAMTSLDKAPPERRNLC